jgi:pSer/pThr/pTyr-binding forkhead associated (FHA) protein
MTAETDDHNNRQSNDRQGPQGTQMFTGESLDDMLGAAENGKVPAGRARLVGVVGPVADDIFLLHGNSLTLGRSAGCDICIDEPSLSSEHARLSASGQGWRIVNLLSTNGIFVNDKKVFAHELRHGDIVRLGRITLRYDDPADQRAQANAAHTGMRKWWQILLLSGVLVAAGVWAYLR